MMIKLKTRVEDGLSEDELEIEEEGALDIMDVDQLVNEKMTLVLSRETRKTRKTKLI